MGGYDSVRQASAEAGVDTIVYTILFLDCFLGATISLQLPGSSYHAPYATSTAVVLVQYDDL